MITNLKFIFRYSCMALLLIGLSALQAQCQDKDLDVPYVPTPQPAVEKMLDVTNVEPGDYVIDLGSGDGRIVIAAARRGAVGHGVDLDPERVSEARQNAIDKGVRNQVAFMQEDIFETDIRQASVITMYLLTSVNRKLRPRLLDELRPGTRIVSHSFDMGDWEPDSTLQVKSSIGRNHTIYYWIIPAQVEGEWNWDVEGKSFDMSVNQQYQEISLSLSSDTGSLSTGSAVLKGERISFSATEGDRHYVFNGRVENDTIKGTVQIHENDDQRVLEWNAAKR